MNSDHAPTAEEQLPLHIQNLYEDSKRDDYMIVGSEVRMVVYELRKALRSNREKDAQLARQEAILKRGGFYPPHKELEIQLVEKDAKIAELKKRCNTFMQGLEAEEKDCKALHAKLRAVSDALETYYEGNQLWGRLARIRAILEGK